MSEMMGPMGPPPGMGAPGGAGPMGPPDAGPMSAVQHLRAAIMHAQAAMEAESDDVVSKDIADSVNRLYGVMASLQKGAESAMGTTPAHKAMGRAYQDSGGGGY